MLTANVNVYIQYRILISKLEDIDNNWDFAPACSLLRRIILLILDEIKKLLYALDLDYVGSHKSVTFKA